MRAVTAIGWVVIALAVTGPARAQHSEEARRHFIEGRKLFKQSKFNQAVRSFNAAYKLRPSPLLDYNIGRCHAELGQRGLAIAAFKRYLDARPNATNREEVLDRLAKLEAAAKPPPDQPAQPPERDREPVGAPTDPRPPQPPTAAEPTPPVHEAAAPLQVPPPSAVEEPGVPAIKGQQSPKVAAAGGAAPAHEATLPAGRRGAKGKRHTKPKDRPRHKAPGHPESGPIYKQWWFWVGCAAAAVIAGFIIGTAASRSDSADAHKSTGGLQITF